MFRRIIICLVLLGDVEFIFAEEGLNDPESSNGWSWVEKKFSKMSLLLISSTRQVDPTPIPHTPYYWWKENGAR
jgi:hypothetical protein